VAIASRFQPRNLAESGFNPFYGEMPEIPLGPGPRRVTGAMVSNPDFASPYVSDSFGSGSGSGSGIGSGTGSGSGSTGVPPPIPGGAIGGPVGLIPNAVGPRDKTLWNWDHIPGYEGDRDPYDWMRMAHIEKSPEPVTGQIPTPNIYRSLPAQSWRNLASKEGYMVKDPEFVKKYGEDVYGPEGFRWSPGWETSKDVQLPPDDKPFPDPIEEELPPVDKPFPDPVEEDLGTPWYLQVMESGAPTMPWNVYAGLGGETNLAPTSNKFNPKTGDFYTYTGPASSSAESAKEVYYEPFYHTPEVRNDPRFFGDRWSIPESLKTAKASLASLYGEDSNTGTGWVRPDDGPSTNLNWPGMEAWLTSSGIPEEDWNSSLYQGWRYNSAAPVNWKIPDPMTMSYPFAYNYETGFGDWA